MSPEEVSAVAAGTAAVATLVLAILTYGYLRATQALVRMAAQQASAATGQLDAQLRPVLALAVDANELQPVSIRSGAASAEVRLRVDNVGLGVALVSAVEVTSPSATVVRAFSGVIVGAGQAQMLKLETPRSASGDWTTLSRANEAGAFELVVRYRDVLGREQPALRVVVERVADEWTATVQ